MITTLALTLALSAPPPMGDAIRNEIGRLAPATQKPIFYLELANECDAGGESPMGASASTRLDLYNTSSPEELAIAWNAHGGTQTLSTHEEALYTVLVLGGLQSDCQTPYATPELWNTPVQPGEYSGPEGLRTMLGASALGLKVSAAPRARWNVGPATTLGDALARSGEERPYEVGGQREYSTYLSFVHNVANVHSYSTEFEWQPPQPFSYTPAHDESISDEDEREATLREIARMEALLRSGKGYPRLPEQIRLMKEGYEAELAQRVKNQE